MADWLVHIRDDNMPEGQAEQVAESLCSLFGALGLSVGIDMIHAPGGDWFKLTVQKEEE